MYQLSFDPASGLVFVSGEFRATTHRQLPMYTWQHLAVTYDGTNVVFYIDGQPVTGGSGTLRAANTAPLEIGNSGSCTAFAGLIDEVSVYNRALSAAEITAIYNAGSAGKGGLARSGGHKVQASAPLAESVTQEVRIEDKFVLGTAKIRWQAEEGDALPLLFGPTVLMGLDYPTNTLELAQAPAGSRAGQQLLARKKGVFDIKVRYELPVTAKNPESGFTLPVPYGLVNRLNLTVVNLDVDVLSPQAVSIQRDTAGSNTVPRSCCHPPAMPGLAGNRAAGT